MCESQGVAELFLCYGRGSTSIRREGDRREHRFHLHSTAFFSLRGAYTNEVRAAMLRETFFLSLFFECSNTASNGHWQLSDVV